LARRTGSTVERETGVGGEKGDEKNYLGKISQEGGGPISASDPFLKNCRFPFTIATDARDNRKIERRGRKETEYVIKKSSQVRRAVER